jgi:large subunit ribosomal protein L9e
LFFRSVLKSPAHAPGCLTLPETIHVVFCFYSKNIVEVLVAARKVNVKGPLGSLERDFKHISMDLRIVDAATAGLSLEENGEAAMTKTFIKVDLWFATRKQLACVRTVCSHIENLFVGVTRGFLYKMRFVYSHFPINVTLTNEVVEIRNFLGEKRVRKVALLPGVKYVRTANVKDQIELSGIDIAAVSLTAAKIQQATTVRNKDLRKFLDGIYVSEKGPTPRTDD